MGSTGAKASEEGRRVASAFTSAVEPLGGITSKAMFGGHGVFREGVMFAIVDPDGRLYLRADATNEVAFDAVGAAHHGRMPYREVPDAVRDDPEELRTWARAAAEVAAGLDVVSSISEAGGMGASVLVSPPDKALVAAVGGQVTGGGAGHGDAVTRAQTLQLKLKHEP